MPGSNIGCRSVEERIALQQHRELQRQFKGRSKDEQEFFCIHGYWPENASELPRRIEFTARGIKTVVTTQWEGEAQKSED
jgi:ribonuclease I